MIRVGILGLDTSHAPAFTGILNNPAHPHHVPGARIVAAWPGGSPDMPVSANRLGKFTDQLRNEFQVPILDDPRAVAESCDLLFMLSVDGRVHLALLKEVAAFKRPLFIDKPLATNSVDAAAIYEIGEAGGFPIMSCSSLRYPDNLTEQLANPDPIRAVDIFGPLNLLPEPPGYFWYGIHCVEVLVTTLGVGAVLSQITSTPVADILTYTYPKGGDGRTATIHLLNQQGGSHHDFGITLHRAKSVQQVNLSAVPRPAYASMLRAILDNLPNGKTPFPKEQTLEIIRLLEQANKARPR